MKKEIMKRATFNMKPSQIERLNQAVELVQSHEDGVNKSDVFREALERGIDSITKEYKAKG